MKKTALVAVALLIGVSVGGCAQDGPAGESEIVPAQEITLAALEGQWELTRLDTDEVDGVTMQVEGDGAFQILNQCNNPRGVFGIDEGTLTLEGPLVVTRMLCEEPIQEREDKIVQIVDQIGSSTLTESGQLQITGGEDSSSLTFQKQ